MTDVKIRMTAEDAASPAINKVKQSLVGFANSQGIMGGIVGGLIGGGMMGVANAAISAAAAIPQMAGEMANLAMQAERTEASFVALSGGVGQSSQEMLASMKRMTAGTVSDTDLMLAANRAMMLGVSDNAEEMGQLMAAAIERGRALGVSSGQAVNDIITGIGRMSPMILDNLGIVGVTQSVEEYARSLGKTADALSDVEKKQALVNAVIASGSGMPVLDDAASSFERMDASIANMKVALGELFGPAIAAVAQQLADAVSGVTESIDASELQASQSELFQLGNTLTGLMAAYDGAITSMQEAAKAANGPGLKEAATQADMLMMSIEAVATSYNEAAAATGAPLIDVALLKTGEIAFYDVATAIDTVGDAAIVATSQVDAFNSALSRMAPVISAVSGIRNAAIGRVESLGLQAVQQGADPSEITAMVGATTDAIWNMGLSYEATTEAQFANKLAVEAQLAPLTSLNEKLRDADKASSGLARGGLSEAERAFDGLRGKVESMLQGALSPNVSIVDGILPREDDINENARRLAAIANEGIGDQSWMEEFKTEVPALFDEIIAAADPRSAAARIFQEFQAGLRPELIDKSLVKERIKAMITGEQEMSALATEIANELAAEMGVSLPQAMAAAQSALGVSPTGDKSLLSDAGAASAAIKPTFDLTDVRAAGATAGLEFAAGMDANGAASKFSSGFMLSMKEFYIRFYASGAASANEYNNGFLTQFRSSVPVEIVLTLATLVTPEVLRNIAARDGTENAQ